MGEIDAYRRLDLRCQVLVEERLVFAERAVLDPRPWPVSSPARQGRFACAGALHCFGGDLADFGSEERRPDLRWSAGGSDQMVMIRSPRATAQVITLAREAALDACWRHDGTDATAATSTPKDVFP